MFEIEISVKIMKDINNTDLLDKIKIAKEVHREILIIDQNLKTDLDKINIERFD